MKTIYSLILFAAMIASCQKKNIEASLSQKNIDYTYMVEEEKLARDVYQLMYDTHQLRVFGNIKESEQRHIEMMQELLKTNAVNFSIDSQRGVFQHKELQTLYNTLVEKGLKSKKDALEVGLAIEEKDIKDLEEIIARTTNENDKKILINLRDASERHKSAFTRNLN